MEEVTTQGEWQSRKITNWLLTLLRFAVTRNNADRICVLEAAREIDRQSSGSDDASFSFFARTSAEICRAIVAHHDAGRQATLARHFNCIEDRRMRAALEAATECGSVEWASPTPANEPMSPKPATRRRDDLWKGLRSR